jgi:integrase/recombinase XerC
MRLRRLALIMDSEPLQVDFSLLRERLAQDGRSPHTQLAYARQWEHLRKWETTHEQSPLAMTEKEAEDLYYAVTGPHSKASKATFLAAMSYAYRSWKQDNPFRFIKNDRAENKTEIRYATGEQIALLLGYLKDRQSRSYYAKLTYTFASFMFYTSTRYDEVAKLTQERILWKNGLPAVARIIGKGNKPDDITLPDILQETLDDWLRYLQIAKDIRLAKSQALEFARSQYLFPGQGGGPYTVHALNHVLKQACLAVHIPQLTSHGLRHSSATLLLNSGASLSDIQTRLRHADISTTMRYLHLDKSRQQSMNQIIEEVRPLEKNS